MSRLAALALAATLAGAGPGWAAATDAHIVDGHFAPNTSPPLLEVLVTVQNDSAFTLQISVNCAAINGEKLEDVAPVAFSNLQPHETGYASGFFNNSPSPQDSVRCRITGADRSAE